MKIVVYGPERRVGAWEGDLVIDLARAYEHARGGSVLPGEGLPSGLLAFIEAGQSRLEKARAAIDHARSGPRVEDPSPTANPGTYCRRSTRAP